jgi:predicted nucleic acid-binding protein
MAKPSVLYHYPPIRFVQPRGSAEAYTRSCLKNEPWSDGVTDLYVLDTSSIFAFTDQEDGADEVERLLNAAKQHECRLEVCAMSLMELYYITLREQGEDEAIRLVALVKSWPVMWIYPDEKTLLQAAKFKASYRLSVADALIAAVAKLHHATLVHKDPEFEAIASQVSLLSLPFKKRG